MGSLINGDPALARAALACGATVEAADAGGCTALFAAANNSQAAVAAALLEHGADVNAADESGSTALIAAAANDDPDNQPGADAVVATDAAGPSSEFPPHAVNAHASASAPPRIGSFMVGLLCWWVVLLGAQPIQRGLQAVVWLCAEL